MLNWPKKRAWGWYATLLRTPWLCIKILRFQPGHCLSMQRHEYRTEIWWFIKGQGRIEYRPHEYTIPPQYYKSVWFNKPFDIWKVRCGWWHKFSALYKPVYAIELQYGSKVIESDIERK